MKTLLGLIFIAVTPILRAEPQKLPSRDTTVVIPLLESFTSNKDYKDVEAILGKADLDIGSASPESSFRLSDGRYIGVKTRQFIVREITLHSPSQKEVKTLFKEPKS